MRRIFIVQARMTSTRLPGKVMMDLDGKPMLSRQIERLKQCRTADDIVLATTINTTDDPLIALATQMGIKHFRGSESDVLSRYLGAARQEKADIVVRVTSDCPLICPEICDLVVNALAENDYASNTLKRTYPRGLDVEAFTFTTLEKTAFSAKSASAREHVTWHIYHEARERFHLYSVEDLEDHSNLRWTVDEAADLEVIRKIWSGLQLSQNSLGYREILAYTLSHPEISALNSTVEQKKPR